MGIDGISEEEKRKNILYNVNIQTIKTNRKF